MTDIETRNVPEDVELNEEVEVASAPAVEEVEVLSEPKTAKGGFKLFGIFDLRMIFICAAAVVGLVTILLMFAPAVQDSVDGSFFKYSGAQIAFGDKNETLAFSSYFVPYLLLIIGFGLLIAKFVLTILHKKGKGVKALPYLATVCFLIAGIMLFMPLSSMAPDLSDIPEATKAEAKKLFKKFVEDSCAISVGAILSGVAAIIAAGLAFTGEIIGAEGAADRAAIKEWFRKCIVNLKKKPQNIPFFLLLVCGVFYLLSLNDFSRTSAQAFPRVEWLGPAVFVTTLFSILVLVLFLNAFPKHPIVNKKTGKKSYINITMLVLGFAFIAAMIALNAVYISILLKTMSGSESVFFSSVDEANMFSGWLSGTFKENPVLSANLYRDYVLRSYYLAIVHIVLLGVTVLAYATLPLYKKLLLKINTRKVLEENNMTEVIDTEDE